MKVIFTATDFSEAGNNAVKYAIGYASVTNSNLVVFHAVQTPRIPPLMGEKEYRVLEKNTEKVNQRLLELVVDKIYWDMKLKRQDKKLSMVAKKGIFVIDTMLAAAKEFSADLIVLGAHGATGLKLLGSTTSEMIFNAPVPVIAVPSDYRLTNIRSVVYASDLVNLLPELKTILPVVNAFKANIEVLNLANPSQQKEAKATIAESLKKFRYQKIKGNVIPNQSQATLIKNLQEYLNKKKPQLLVLFPEERSFYDKLFVKSKTERLSYMSKLPLLTFRKSIVRR